jgi:hypothetical protein
MFRYNPVTGRGAFNLQYSIPNGDGSFFWCFYLWQGYGESLIDYNHSITRVGLAPSPPMNASRHACAALLCLLALGGCASNPAPANTGGVGLEVPLDATSDPATLAYEAPDLDVSKYHAFLIEDAQVYHGDGADFDGTDPADCKRLAEKISAEFRRVLGEKYPIVDQPAPGVVRLQLTLAAINGSVPVVSTLLRLTPVGLGMTAIRSATGKPAKLTGSVTIAGMARDAVSGKILGAIVSRRSPPAYDLTSGLTTLGAAQEGITEGAVAFRDLVEKLQHPEAKP